MRIFIEFLFYSTYWSVKNSTFLKFIILSMLNIKNVINFSKYISTLDMGEEA